MTFDHLVKSIPHHFKQEELKLLELAYEFSRRAHMGQKRKSGEDYFVHPVEAAIILGKIFPDITSLAAELLHDVTENTQVTIEDLEQNFGKTIAGLVDGVSKLGTIRLRNSKEPQYVESLRKMFLATSQDVRVIMIKLADRLHNIRTLQHLPEDKQRKIATETLEIYAPIAARLGINTWKDELEDSCFSVVDPEKFAETKTILSDELAKKEKNIKALEKELTSILKLEGVKFIGINGRTKRVYSLFKKLKKKHDDISKIYDVIALRVICKSTADCYAALGAIHQHFLPMPGRIKDYIAMPKPNGYQSLHTTVFDRNGSAFEIQLRTDLMQEAAERGIAAHWFYSQSGKQSAGVSSKYDWIHELRKWQEEIGEAEDFMENLKIDFFKDRIFVLTPKGDVKDLPSGATCIDFAFSVHSDLGYYMMGAKINGKMASIYDELSQGVVVEILKSKQPVKISRDWLNAARTSAARSKIRQYLKEHDKGLINRVKELRDMTIPTFFRKK